MKGTEKTATGTARPEGPCCEWKRGGDECGQPAPDDGLRVCDLHRVCMDLGADYDEAHLAVLVLDSLAPAIEYHENPFLDELMRDARREAALKREELDRQRRALLEALRG